MLEDGRFALTPLAEPLRTDVPGSLRALAQYFAVEADAWGAVLHSVRTGGSGWEQALGVGHYEYFARNPEASAHFDAAMAGNTSRTLPDILAAYDFGALGVVVDVAGGRGPCWRASYRHIRTCGASCSTSPTSSPRPRPC